MAEIKTNGTEPQTKQQINDENKARIRALGPGAATGPFPEPPGRSSLVTPWDVLQIKMDIGLGKRGSKEVPTVIVHPDDMYPIVLDRILYVLESREIPYELNAPRERGGEKRGRAIVGKALAVPTGGQPLGFNSWQDARSHRDMFTDLPVTTDYDLMKAQGLPERALAELMRLKWRARALDIALGWFQHALRIRIGGHQGRYLSGDGRWRI